MEEYTKKPMSQWYNKKNHSVKEWFFATIAQLVERSHGKGEVTSSSLVSGSMIFYHFFAYTNLFSPQERELLMFFPYQTFL